MEPREINRYKSNIIFNIVLSISFLMIIYFWILPKYETMEASIINANNEYTTYKKIESEWLTYTEIKDALPNLADNILADETKVNIAIKKDGNVKTYLEWINIESAKKWEQNEKRKRNNKIIWSIIPVLYNEKDDSTINEKITLGSFIQYVEKYILNEYNIESYIPLWLENISFKEDDSTDANWTIKKWINSSIWSFNLTLELNWKNKDIINMINFIQSSWKIDNKNDELIDNTKNTLVNQNCSSCSSLSNLLINIDSLELKNIPENNEKVNSWKIVLRFYVRSLWFEQFKEMQSRILERVNWTEKIEWLDKKIKKYSTLCNTLWDAMCLDMDWAKNAEYLKKTYKEYATLKKKMDERMKALKIDNLDINEEIRYWMKLNNSLNNIESKIKNGEIFINNYKNKWLVPKSN